jgi:hypothetical protein
VGKILDPCRGKGAFSDKMICDWCEINEGQDFLRYLKVVDWCFSNPPYSLLNKFTRHAMSISENIVWLIPPWKIFQAYGLVKAINEWGGIKEIRWYGTGARLGFPMGNGIGAVHLKRKYVGDMEQSFYD